MKHWHLTNNSVSLMCGRAFTVLALLCAVTLSVPGCGNSSDTEPSDDQSKTADATPGADATTDKTSAPVAGQSSSANDNGRAFPRRLNSEGIYIGTTYDRSKPGATIQYVFQVQTIYSRLEMSRLFGIYNDLVLSSGLDEIHLEIFKEEYSKGFTYMGEKAQWRGVILVAELENGVLNLQQPYYWGITGGTNLMQQISPELVDELGDRQFRHILLGSCCDDSLRPEVHWQEPRAGYPMEDNGEFLYWKFKDLRIVGTQFHATAFTSLNEITQQSFEAELDRLDAQ